MTESTETSWTKGASTIRVGAFTYGHRKITIREWGEGANLTIGKFCSIANGVVVMLGGNHRVDWITTYPFGHIHQDILGGTDIVGHPISKGDVMIGHDVWLGSRCSIMSGISIGTGAVVAANSSLSQDVPPYTIVGGNPAKPIKQRFPDEIVSLLLELRWWDLDPEIIREIAPELSQTPSIEGLRSLIKRYR